MTPSDPRAVRGNGGGCDSLGGPGGAGTLDRTRVRLRPFPALSWPTALLSKPGGADCHPPMPLTRGTINTGHLNALFR